MLFFFEFGTFILAIVAFAVAETVGRSAATALVAVALLVSLVGRLWVARAFRATPPSDAQHAKWRQAVLDAWRHFTLLVSLGLIAFALWWRIGG